MRVKFKWKEQGFDNDINEWWTSVEDRLCVSWGQRRENNVRDRGLNVSWKQRTEDSVCHESKGRTSWMYHESKRQRAGWVCQESKGQRVSWVCQESKGQKTSWVLSGSKRQKTGRMYYESKRQEKFKIHCSQPFLWTYHRMKMKEKFKKNKLSQHQVVSNVVLR